MRMSKVALLHAICAMGVAITRKSKPDGHVEWVEPNGWADPTEAFPFAGFTPSKVDKKPNKVSQKKRRLKARRLGH
ncbi:MULTISPECIES: hypothetical protein [unclassified Acinetobacter]|uniref:hypothetical protein n=1 Tax=unclassified Acinetobacter TaxID=196816 RepID=UPI002447DB31|nr:MULTISPECIES: hypothetical protein [unclassified Acinetobacter]MDH0032572.1 hypothetical protein [Acinetobacter sp. GD04021]MDH0885263.1 hypothetical protein [Acinetobacter sp. GD03873]MDH1084409.1 hypothetical protein [Acinetobacter sp. GD03983]MDH2188297.1 hypothetical protein [Acinetobacter sp. GD03645]MDH2203808.1 hypothetical protein [Acinetobacter sp. GD03647]